MVDDHLMDKDQFNEFVYSMWCELGKHKDEKKALANVAPQDVFSISMIDIKKRVTMMNDFRPSTIEKQSVHTANYLFFMWCKAREALRNKNGVY